MPKFLIIIMPLFLGSCSLINIALYFSHQVAVVLSLLVEFDVIGLSTALSNNTDYMNSSLAVNEVRWTKYKMWNFVKKTLTCKIDKKYTIYNIIYNYYICSLTG
jgi:hypothetical protein